jgi:hypothetical protein
MKMLNNGGADHSIPLQYENITPYPINGVKDGEPGLYFT